MIMYLEFSILFCIVVSRISFTNIRDSIEFIDNISVYAIKIIINKFPTVVCMNKSNKLNHCQLRSKLEQAIGAQQYFYFKFKHYNPVHKLLTH